MNDETNMTFDNFIVYDNNRSAYERALMVAECPGASCRNPLFIWGNNGLGKTHLLHAIRNKIFDKDSEKKVLYVTCETLVEEFLECIKTKEYSTFREKYSSADILLVDNFQFLNGKEGVGTDLFGILGKYICSGKQLVLSCEKRITNLSLSPRIINLIRSGIGAHVQSPDYLARRKYLLNKVKKSENCQINDAAINYLCDKDFRNFQEIDSAVDIISACYMFENLDVDIELVKSVIDPILQMRIRKAATPEVIIDEVTKYYGVERDNVIGPVDFYKSDYPQIVAMFICFRLLGRELTLKKHIFNTSMNARRVALTVKENAELQSDIERILKKIHKWQLDNE